jgi:hypothetical protein
MPAPIISTNAANIQAYASRAEEELGNISAALTDLVTECTSVAYWGQNGRDFKAKTGASAVRMSSAINTSMKAFIGQVNDANDAIAKTLGSSVTIDGVATPTLELPKVSETGPNGETGEGIYPAAMETLQSTVNDLCRRINTAATAHENALTSQTPEWQGDKKGDAVRACRTFTDSVTSAVSTGLGEITNAIAAQKAATEGADA